MTDEINMNSLILMHYSIALTNGIEIESSFNDEPVEINMGSGDVTEGMELALFGLKEGDKQTLTLTAEQGFGLRDEDNIHEMPLSDFPEDLLPEVGLSYSFESPEDGEIPGTVLSIKDDMVEIDFNHPLAGQEIVFTVDILGVNNAQAEIK
ncbi:MAG: FKBP-type peptidyl-prolyl cis-trans isomerase [Gammaproteobacteria bacterium]|jgi:FKBP-type peptidyl-prolyl cis-trans isomerase SlpA|nr:FKBP-type peptidyl-prolyl cis-trans isomerase [Gammaproteobacteria bacterium]